MSYASSSHKDIPYLEKKREEKCSKFNEIFVAADKFLTICKTTRICMFLQ